MPKYTFPPKDYLQRPTDESCYEYMLKSYDRISKDLGKDYTAFITPVGPVEILS